MFAPVIHVLYTGRVEWAAIVCSGIALLLSAAALLHTVAKKNAASVDTHARSELRRLDSDLDDVFDRLKRLTSRKGMQARREETKAGAMLPGESPDAWKRRMRKARQNGAQLETPEEV